MAWDRDKLKTVAVSVLCTVAVLVLLLMGYLNRSLFVGTLSVNLLFVRFTVPVALLLLSAYVAGALTVYLVRWLRSRQQF